MALCETFCVHCARVPLRRISEIISNPEYRPCGAGGIAMLSDSVKEFKNQLFTVPCVDAITIKRSLLANRTCKMCAVIAPPRAR